MYKYVKSFLFCTPLSSVAFISVLMTISLFACKTQGSGSEIRSIGAPGELLLVMDHSIEKSSVKTIMADFANVEFPAIPQPEPTFRLTTIGLENFEGHFKSYRNIIVIKSAVLQKAKIQFRQDVWASNQQVVEMTYNDEESFVDLFNSHKNQLFNFLYKGDIKSMSEANKKGADEATKQLIKEKYNINMVLPQGYRLVKDTAGFTWFRFDRLETIQSIIIHEFDMDSVTSLEPDDLVALRNNVGRKYVPGPQENTFMSTVMALPVISNDLVFNNLKVRELRGLWKVEGYLMGGPFVNYFLLDDKNHKLLMVEGFVFAPRKQNKAFYVRQIESILQSIKFF
jgi:hypothetical protein